MEFGVLWPRVGKREAAMGRKELPVTMKLGTQVTDTSPEKEQRYSVIQQINYKAWKRSSAANAATKLEGD